MATIECDCGQENRLPDEEDTIGKIVRCGACKRHFEPEELTDAWDAEDEDEDEDEEEDE